MKVFLLSVLAVYVQGELCKPNCDACKENPDIAKITWGKATDCSIEKGSAYADGEDVDYLLGDDTKIKEITADGCRKKCKEQMKDTEHPQESDYKCEYFHWQEAHEEGQTDKITTTCSLQTTCQPSGYCESFDCVSGQLGCNAECETSLPCSLTKTEWVHGNFHVICTDTTQDDGDVDIYSDDIVGKDIPDGTICNTIRKCSAWTDQDAEDGTNYYRQLAVQCDGSADPATWKPREDTGDNALSTAMIESNTIKEQVCTAACDPITITNSQEWADLVCDNPLGDGNALEDGNSCILLCDNHLRMTIDCKYVVEGDKKWQDAHGVELTDADIKC